MNSTVIIFLGMAILFTSVSAIYIHPTYRVPKTNPPIIRVRRGVSQSEVFTPNGHRIKTFNINEHRDNFDFQGTFSQGHDRNGRPLPQTYNIKTSFRF
ncbi:hypothetical protein WA026_020639 [Henosepilachna vigintioctopunctata]|uniref:Uncharacterized protein n=1 Tax=Henosepilachna vigintioctopunctata TaxID=420089 RepID=A0AAW1UUL4_9CUCU